MFLAQKRMATREQLLAKAIDSFDPTMWHFGSDYETLGSDYHD